MLFKIPLFVTEIVIPIASAQMRKVILKYSAERQQKIIQFVLNSAETNIDRITKTKMSEDWWKNFDENMQAKIKELVPEISQGGGGKDDEDQSTNSVDEKSFPELVANFLTQLNTNDLPLLDQLFQIAEKFPNIFEVINIIPKSVDDFFTTDMFDKIMHEAVCEEMYNIMMSPTVTEKLKEEIVNFPTQLELTTTSYNDFIEVNKTKAKNGTSNPNTQTQQSTTKQQSATTQPSAKKSLFGPIINSVKNSFNWASSDEEFSNIFPK